MDVQNATYACTTAFVDELGRAGVQHAVVCPGSRSTPLAFTLAAQDAIKVWMLIDERSAAFFALGIAKATQRPVILVCTSGTAAANFLPAVAEAHLGRVPLIVLTADRPPELRDVGAPQTMDQLRLFGTHVKWFSELPLPEASNTLLRYNRTVAGRAVATALAAPAGPVHLNLPFREPLTPAPIIGQSLPPITERELTAWTGRVTNQPYVGVTTGRRTLDQDVLDAFATRLMQAERGLIIVGPQPDLGLVEPLTKLAAQLGFPILADPLSLLRCGPFDHRLIVDTYDVFLRDEQFVQDAAPALVLRFGTIPTSKSLLLYLNAHPEAALWVVDCDGWNDPMLAAEEHIHAEPQQLVQALLPLLPKEEAQTSWTRLWQSTAQLTRTAIEGQLEEFSSLFEGRVFSELAQALPEGTSLVVGNSMPIRDCDTFFAGSSRSIRVLGNRGVNGIDGLVSTALGVAAVSRDPVVLVLGDLSFYHDLNGLLAAKLHGLKLTIVVVNNDGGGIFSFLPQAAYPEHFETLFGTPHGLDFAQVVAMYGGRFQRVHDWHAFRSVLEHGLVSDGLTVVELPTDRATNVTLHRQVWQVVAHQLKQHAAGVSS